MSLLTKNKLDQALHVVRETGLFLKAQQKRLHEIEIHEKGRNDLVSEVDINAEKLLIEKLSKIIPEADFLTEEHHPDAEITSKKPMWIIDPLDGTTNYLHGFPVYSVSVALMENGKTTAGIVYDVKPDEMFYASELSESAYLDKQVIQVSRTSRLVDALLATGFPSREFDQITPYGELMKDLMLNTHGLRRLGSAALDLAYVACGRFDGFFETGLAPWDVAAGNYIIEKAGGIVTDYYGNEGFNDGKSIVTANRKIHKKLAEKTIAYMGKS